MLTKYEKLKIASNVLGKTMKEICDAESKEIREACLDSRKYPEITKRIDDAIEESEKSFKEHRESKVAKANQ